MPKQKVEASVGRPRLPRETRPRAKPQNLSDSELVARAIEVSKLTDSAFAETVLKCHPRTVRKYLSGRKLPKLSRDVLLALVGAQ